LIVICQVVLRRQRRSQGTARAAPEGEFVSDIPLMVVLAGALLPWWPWLGDLIVMAGCLAWLACYLRMKIRRPHSCLVTISEVENFSMRASAADRRPTLCRGRVPATRPLDGRRLASENSGVS